MAKLFTYFGRVLNQKLVVPSSGMGKVAPYMLKRQAGGQQAYLPFVGLDSGAMLRRPD